MTALRENEGQLKNFIRSFFPASFRSLVRRYTDIHGFKRDAGRFLGFLESIPRDSLPQPAPGAKRAGFMVTPWHYTAVPWFSIAMAYLYRYRGFEVCILWDDCRFDEFEKQDQQNEVIASILERVKADMKVVKVSDFAPSSLDDQDRAEMKRLAILNSIKFYKSSALTEKHGTYEKHVEDVFSRNLASVKPMVAAGGFDHIVIPGGIYGNSGLFVWAGRRCGVRAATYDSGFGTLVLGVDSIAAHQMDLRKIDLERHFATIPGGREKALEMARGELQRRREGGGFFNFQKGDYKQTDGLKTCDVLIPLNLDWDTTALGKESYFDHPIQWLFETVRWLLDNTDATIGVRQHPIERFPLFRSTYDLPADLEKHFGGHPRFHFWSAYEEINSYRLFEKAKVVLPFASTTGVEAASCGIPVVMESNVYYSELPFVEKAKSKQDYFDKIKAVIENGRPYSAEKAESALLCYFISQIATWIPTDFTPQPVDFRKQMEKGFSALLADRAAQSVITTLIDAVPTIVWQSREILTRKGA